jgi:transforming growth factor-beta-induced protein
VIEGFPPVDVLVDGATAVDVLGFPGAFGSNDGVAIRDLPAGTYDIQVVESAALTADGSTGRVIFDLPETRLDPNINYFIAAVGTPADAQIVVVPTNMPNRTESSIADIVAGDPRLSTLLAAVDAAGLVDVLAEGGPFTVFAPNDAAFAAALELVGVSAEDLLSNTELLTQILTYHVVPGVVSAEALAAAGSVTTLEGSEITAAESSFGAILNGSIQTIRPDNVATNGIVHKIDGVLLPPALIEALGVPTQTIAEIAVENGSFTTLVAALQAAGLVDLFADSNAGPFTVFAPTDEAFATALDSLGLTAADVLADTELLTSILTYHVVEGVVTSDVVVTLDSATTLQGSDIAISVVDGGVVLNDSINVVATDIRATNGVIHVIDNVLLPPMAAEEEMAAEQTIAEIASGNGFNILVAALEAADLVDLFADPTAGPFTVFAPTDEAFLAALAALEVSAEDLLADTELLTSVLTYHVVAGAVTSDVVVTLDAATTLQGSDITITVTDDGVVLNDNVNVTAVDIMASNGVIHVIDAVLLPPAAE